MVKQWYTYMMVPKQGLFNIVRQHHAPFKPQGADVKLMSQ